MDRPHHICTYSKLPVSILNYSPVCLLLQPMTGTIADLMIYFTFWWYVPVVQATGLKYASRLI
jgi:hypothetical protein